ncbi:MAG: ABC transporter substrate-binding protein, partial [Spirochaetes bacterium]|nr:ABC transporter substrate-binding protein [Spirochaetota bacterium]
MKKKKDMRKISIFIIILLVIACLSTSWFWKKKKASADDKKILHYYQNAEPQTLDAQVFTGNPEMTLANMYHEGLTRYGKKDGEYLPGVAEKYTFNASDNSWTFVIRKNAKWEDGKPVTPHDFAFAWR